MRNMVLAALSVCFLFGCTAAVEISDETSNKLSKIDNTNAAAFIALLNAEIPKLLTQHDVPGASIALVSPQRGIWAKGFGFANVESKLPTTSNTVFQVASISKSLTAVAVMKLVQQGKIDLDAPVETYLSRWQLPDSEYSSKEVTVRRLLNHTAGLSVSGYFGFSPQQPLPTIEGSLKGELGSHSLFSSLTNILAPSRANVHIIEQPGKRRIYSGGGYTVLQLLIEEVSGQSFSDYMNAEVLTPLGMTSSHFEENDIPQSRIATSYTGLFQSPSPRYHYTAKAAAGLYSTSTDLAKFITFFLAQEREKGSDEAHTPLLNIKTTHIMLDDNLGINKGALSNQQAVYMHTGSNAGGWQSVYMFSPEAGHGIVVLTNGSNGRRVYQALLQMWGTWVASKQPKVN